MAKTQKKKEEQAGESKEEETKIKGLSSAVPAEVLELIGRIGGKNTTMQVRCKILDGSDSGKITRRNVLGPVRKGDTLMLTQTEMEATPLKGSRK